MVETERRGSVEERVVRAAEATLAERKMVSAVDVLLGLRWLAPSHVDVWRQGRVETLEALMQVRPDRLSAALDAFSRWAKRRGLQPTETAYVARTRDRRPLRFSASGASDRELAYRTHWVSADVSERQREQLAERESRPPDLVVVEPIKEWTCASCGGTGDFLLMEDAGPLCMTCADLDHLVFLPAGDAVLTRRAKKASGLSAVVVRFSRARKRYERQGILVEESALERAEEECLADEEARARRRGRDEEQRAKADVERQERMTQEIHRLFPGCPPERADAIAARAAQRGSGRVGRSAAGRALDPEALTLAVVASIRHEDTPYDELLMAGADRAEARERVRPDVEQVLERWRGSAALARFQRTRSG
jgi:hypothetical protein